MESVNVLYLEQISDSIKFRPYLKTIDSLTIIEWWMKYFSPYPSNSHLCVVCHSEADRLAISSLLTGTDAVVHRPADPSLFGVLAEIAEMTQARRLAVLPLGMCLAPPDLLERAYVHHGRQENKITYVFGFPATVSPIILERECIPATASASQQARTQKAGDQRATGVQSDSVAFQAATAYSLDAVDLPSAFSLDVPKDVETLGRVLHLMQEPRLRSQGLQLWKKERIQEHEATAKGNFSQVVLPEKRRRRLLFVSALSGFSGAEQVLCDLVAGFDSFRFEKIALTVLEGHLTDRLRKAGAKVICAEHSFVENKVTNFLYCMSMLREIQPDIIHQNGPAGVPLVSAARELGIPLLLHAHFAPDGSFAEYAESADAIVAISEFVKSQVARFNVLRSKIHTVYNGIDCEHYQHSTFDKAEARAQLGLNPEAKLVLCTARFDPQKRHDLLLRACAIARKHVPSFAVILNGESFGNTKHHSLVQKQAESLGLKDLIYWIPFARDIRLLQVASDVLVLCSEGEGMGRCIMEAMAMELPVIATASGGIPEIVINQQTGLLVNPSDCEGLARAMISVLNHPEIAEPLTAKARLHIEEKYSLKQQSRAIEQIYEDLSRLSVTLRSQSVGNAI